MVKELATEQLLVATLETEATHQEALVAHLVSVQAQELEVLPLPVVPGLSELVLQLDLEVERPVSTWPLTLAPGLVALGTSTPSLGTITKNAIMAVEGL